MFYEYDKRMNELERISNIDNQEEKKESLENFIEQEKQILNKLPGLQERSQALDSAMRKLKSITIPREANLNSARKLLF